VEIGEEQETVIVEPLEVPGVESEPAPAEPVYDEPEEVPA
jgi:hypothetical protein